MANAITNPLYGLKIGSIAFSEPPHFSGPVISSPITQFIPGASGKMSMSGSSEYIYSDQMNQVSAGLSGSYGVSGISKFSGKLSAYYGHTEAHSGKNLSIMLDTIDWTGVEYIDFGNLSAAQLMDSLSAGPKARLTAALTKFVAMQKALGSTSDPAKLVTGQGTLKPEAQAWLVAVEEFYKECGTGFVMGVLWGGWGTAKLEFHTTGEENRWKYGGSGNFTYAGVATTVSFSAAYGGSQSKISQTASAAINVSYNGACVQAKVEQWFKDLTEIAKGGLNALGNTEITRNATLAAPIDAPTIPDFVAPKKDSKVTDLFKEITSLDGLKAYAQAAAWQKQKDAGNTESLHGFLNKVDDNNDVSGVPDPDLSDFKLLPPNFSLARTEPPLAPVQADPPPKPDLSKYEPMGVWIVNWAQLFPWLVTGHDNAVTKDAQALQWIRLKTFYQDCLALTRLYDRLNGEGCSVLLNGAAVDFRGISDSFSHMASLVGDFLLSHPNVATVPDKIRSFISQMSADAQKIYARWDQVPHFRRCELGAGIIFFRDGTTLSGLKLNGSVIDIQREACEFQEPIYFASADYSTFARYGKAWPFILPNGYILAFLSTGTESTSGILTIRQDDYHQFGSWKTTFAAAKQAVCPPTWNMEAPADSDFWYGKPVAFVFTVDDSVDSSGAFYNHFDLYDPQLNYKRTLHRLWPIPFDAADGVHDWTGCAMTTGMGTLGNDLKSLKDELSKLKRYNFDSDFWEGSPGFTDADETKDLFYSMEELKLSYMGVTDAPPNIMRGGSNT